MLTTSLPVGRDAVESVEQELPTSLRKRAIASFAPDRRRHRATGPKKNIGFIGLDPIAQAMASRLLRAGHQLRLYDPAREIPGAFRATMGSVANSVQDACLGADAVFTMLPDDEVAEAVILGSGGVLEGLERNAIHIGSSTISVGCSDRIVEAHWDAGKQYLSAPMLVRSESSAEMQLLVIAGGDEATILEIEPLLAAVGQLAHLTGWPSNANRVQLVVNRSAKA